MPKLCALRGKFAQVPFSAGAGGRGGGSSARFARHLQSTSGHPATRS